MNIQPLRHGLARLHRGLEFDRASCMNRVFSQPVRKPPHYSHAVELSVAQQQHLENDNSLHAHSPCFARVTRQRFRRDLGFDVNFLRLIACDLIAIEKVRERAIVSATVVLVFIGGYL